MQLIPEQKTKSIKEIGSYIQTNFKDDEMQLKAAYFYVISTISYDVAHNFSSELFSSDEDFVAKTMATKKGVCIHYAKFFKAILDNLGYRCQIVTGYTKQNNQIGKQSHAWCAVQFKDKNWYIFDPTWDSGYVQNDKFFSKLSSKHFKVLPSKAVISYMPFDYLWQFSREPISNIEFYNGKPFEGKPKLNYDFQAEIEKYLKLSEMDKAFESAERTEKNGLVNDLILEEYNYKKNIFSSSRNNQNIEKYNEIIEEYNVAIVLLNDFIIYRNKGFSPSFSDAILLEMINTPKERLENVRKEIFALGSVGKENTSSFNTLKSSISETVKQAQQHYDFVKEYLSKSKKDRKNMLTKFIKVK